MKLEPTPEGQLVERALGGDPEALGELVSRYHRVVFSIAYRMTGTRMEAEDLCQDVFLEKLIGTIQLSLVYCTLLLSLTSLYKKHYFTKFQNKKFFLRPEI